MKILVTGGTGFIGKNLVPKLTKNHDVLCLVRNEISSSYLKNFGAKLALGDILDKESISNNMENADIVIHLATSHSHGKEDFNLIGSKNIIEICEKNKVKKFIFISSMATKRKILDSYGKSKLKIERIIKDSNLNYTILRPTMIYSNKDLSLIGKCLKAIPFIIPIIGEGKYKLDPVYLEDVTEAIALCINNNKKTINKSYDISGGEKLTFNNIIKICEKKFNIKKIIIHIPIKFCLILFKIVPIISQEALRGINEDTNADITSLKNDLNISPIKFSEGIKNVNL